MNENVKVFLAKVSEDKELQEKLADAQTVDEAYAFASSVQDGFTKEEFIDTMMAVREQLMDELSEEELALIAGGAKKKEGGNTTTIGYSMVYGSVVTLITALMTTGL